MSISQIKILELLSARMFHDLAGPIGAIHNSIEFLEEDNNPVIKEKAIKIVKSSSDEAIIRLKFFRYAYGNVDDNEVSLHDIKPLIQDFLIDKRFKLSWEETLDKPVNSYIAKIIMNFIVIASMALIQGGSLNITHNNEGVKIVFQDKNVILSEDTKSLLKGDLTHITLTSTNIQIYYTYLMIQAAKAKITINKITDGVEFIIA